MYEPHPLYPNMPPETATWRYIDIEKFDHLISTSSIYFRRADLLKKLDRREGSLTNNENIFINKEIVGKKLYKYLKQHNVQKLGNIQIQRKSRRKLLEELGVRANLVYQYYLTRTYINCWQMSEHENNLMWSAYLNGKPGVALKSSISRLESSLEESMEKVNILAINYIDHDKDDTASKIFNGGLFSVMENMILKKSLLFEGEKELRLFASTLTDEEKFNVSLLGDHLDLNKINDSPCVEINVSLPTMIDSIVLVPGISETDEEKIGNILKEFPELKQKIVKSSLD